MALGTDGLITVVGDFDTLDGSPVSGKVTVTPSVEIRRGAIIYPQLPTVIPLDADGKFSIKLPSSDDSAVSPNGFTYRFDVAVTALVNGRTVTDTSSTNFALPIAGADSQGVARLSTLAPAAQVGTPTIFLTRAAADVRYALKGEGGGGGGGGLDAEAVRDLVGGVLVAGANVSIAVDDAANTVTISSTGGGGGGSTTITIASITDATAVGKSILAATNAAAARSAIGAGTSSLAVGTGATDAKRGDYVPTWSELGTVPTSSLPPLAINDVFTVASQAAMLALTAQRGDMAIRTDTGGTFVLATDSPTTLADWKAISAAGTVNSVNGKTGTIVLAPGDIAGFSTVATTGAYGDLTGKPAIPTVSAAGVSGSYADLTNKPTIPAAATTATTLALLPNLLKNWARIPIDMAVGTITYNASGAPTGHGVEWPDGATGVYAGTANATFGGSIDSYTVTHVLAGTTTTTYTQPAVTRDATTGQLTARPTITVA